MVPDKSSQASTPSIAALSAALQAGVASVLKRRPWASAFRVSISKSSPTEPELANSARMVVSVRE